MHSVYLVVDALSYVSTYFIHVHQSLTLIIHVGIHGRYPGIYKYKLILYITLYVENKDMKCNM